MDLRAGRPALRAPLLLLLLLASHDAVFGQYTTDSGYTGETTLPTFSTDTPTAGTATTPAVTGTTAAATGTTAAATGTTAAATGTTAAVTGTTAAATGTTAAATGTTAAATGTTAAATGTTAAATGTTAAATGTTAAATGTTAAAAGTTASQVSTTAAATTAAATAPAGTPNLWIMVPIVIKLSTTYVESWMADKSSTQFLQLAADTDTAVTPLIVAEFGDLHVLTELDRIEPYLDRVRLFVNCTMKTTVNLEANLDTKIIEADLKTALRTLGTISGEAVNGFDVVIEDYEIVPPFISTTPMETTLREKRSTTAMDPSTTTSEQTTNSTTVTATAEVNTTTVAANTTTLAPNTTTVATTTEPTTTEAPPPVSAKLSCQIRITSIAYEDWMTLSFTSQYTQLKADIEAVAEPVLVDKFGDYFRSVAVIGFKSGSVLVDMEVVVMTNETRAEDVDAKKLSEETTIALQNLYEEGKFTFDPEAVHTKEEIEVIEPTTSPAPTEDPYRHTIMRFEMRAPFANWSEALNETDSDEWAWMELQVKTGIELMLSKKYPGDEWNISTAILYMNNATEDFDDAESEMGVKITFMVSVEPQMTNTSKIVQELAKSFVYFNKLGALQIAPDSVYFKDLTTYAPGRGVVIMDEDYLRELRKGKYNGSYVGDYTTQPPTLRPVIKRHKGFVLGIAVPAFIGMIAAIGLLLICTTIAGAKKSDD